MDLLRLNYEPGKGFWQTSQPFLATALYQESTSSSFQEGLEPQTLWCGGYLTNLWIDRGFNIDVILY